MKKLMLLLLSSITITANSQEWVNITGTVTCGPLQEIVGVLTEEKFKETPLWAGKSLADVTGFVLFFNADRGNFTLLQYYKDRACILGMGTNGKILNQIPFQEKY